MPKKDSEYVGLPYEKHSETSKNAAKKVLPYANTARYRVFKYISEHPRCCDWDIALGLDMNPNTERPRRIELERFGLIIASGKTQTPKGTEAVAFVVTGKPYLDPWPTSKPPTKNSRLERPTPEEFAEAAYNFKLACLEMKNQGRPLSAVTGKVYRWILKQGEPIID